MLKIINIYSEKMPNAMRRFEEFSQKGTDSIFIDIEELAIPEMNEGNVEQFITDFFIRQGIKREDLFKNRDLAAA